jgi:hypothetical protein
MTVFMFFIFSTLGISMLYLSQVHLKLSGYKRNSRLLDYASENGIKQGFNQLSAALAQCSPLQMLEEEEIDELVTDSKNNGIQILKKIFESGLPSPQSDNWKNLIWECHTVFSLNALKEKEEFFETDWRGQINSTGKIENFKQEKGSHLVTDIGILGGHIPLPFIPFLLNSTENSEDMANFLEKNNIEWLDPRKNRMMQNIIFSNEELLPQNTHSQVNKALKLNLFRPQDLSTSQLREALGLEPSNDPVPENVYLIEDDMGLGGIFVEGDLDELILAIEEEFQVIFFKIGDNVWILKFDPRAGKTVFISPEDSREYDRIPLGIIIVNGSIESMGGGQVDSSGNVTMLEDEELSSILNGVDLTIISSDEITLTSHLIHQGVKWEDGIPYIKDSSSQLNIFASGQDVFGNSSGDGKITIGENAPEEMKIQASLTASEKGFYIEGEDKTVHLLGSLHASDYISGGSSMKFSPDESFLLNEDFQINAPKTAKPVLFLSTFSVLEWQENPK